MRALSMSTPSTPATKGWRSSCCAALAAMSLLLVAGIGRAVAAADDAAAHAEHREGGSTTPSPPPGSPAYPQGDKAMPKSMDHGEMNMQGGSAPPDARDPNAYSGGFTRSTGPYALGTTLTLADQKPFANVLFDRFEWVNARDGGFADYDGIARFGTSYNRLVVKAEGEIKRGELQDARTELLWGHAIATYWDTQLGVRNDSGTEGPDRNWLAFGVQGLAPYWFEVDATAYVGNNGRTALRLSGEYELLLTQRWILQPRVELNAYGKEDVENGIGKGLSDLSVGLRLRYEVTRQFAPYVGVVWGGKFAQTADLARAAGESTSQTTWVAGVRFWF